MALATKHNRIALRGGLDFANARFDDVSVALVDSRGCAKVQQKISGAFRNPVVDDYLAGSPGGRLEGTAVLGGTTSRVTSSR